MKKRTSDLKRLILQIQDEASRRHKKFKSMELGIDLLVVQFWPRGWATFAVTRVTETAKDRRYLVRVLRQHFPKVMLSYDLKAMEGG